MKCYCYCIVPIGEVDMKLTNVSELQGGEYLARPIKLDGNTILIYEGTSIKKEYINQLIEIGVESVYIKEQEDDEKTAHLNINETLYRIFKDWYLKIENLMEQHTYDRRHELKAVLNVAEELVHFIIHRSKEEDNSLYESYYRHRTEYNIYEHTLHVTITAVKMANIIGLDRNALLDIAIGALLHDIGFRYITCDFMNRELHEMEPQQTFEYKKHAIYGYTAVEGEDWLSAEAKMILLFHHERMDGSGFPMKQKKLSLYSKIVSICDHLDSRVCGIGCRRNSISDALDEIVQGSGKVFDSKLVDVLLTMVPKYLTGSIVRTNQGDIAMVIQQNSKRLDRPILKYMKSNNGKVVNENITVDLGTNTEINIVEVIEH